MVAAFAELALHADSDHNGGRLRAAAARLGLAVTDLPKDPESVALVPRSDLAWRVPLGLAAALIVRGQPLRLAAPGGAWFASLPPGALGRRVADVSVSELSAGRVPFAVRMVKLVAAKLTSFAATRTRDTPEAAAAVHRAGQAWGPLLHTHRASFHDDAARFAATVLAGLPEGRVPPACVLDIARQPDGRLVVLEANTTWGAGLYGCDPDQVLRAVLAANEPTSPEWAWTPDPVLVQRVNHRT